MTIKDDLTRDVDSFFRNQWTLRDGQVVPTDQSLTFSNTGINLDAAVLYADLSESTKMVDSQTRTFSAEIYKAFLHCAAKIVRLNNGIVTAYDGDRIMAVFNGGRKNTEAAKSGLQINWCCKKLIQPAIQRTYPNKGFTLKHTVGIDSSNLLVAKTGVRGANDLVWVGRAANWAAKLTNLSNDYATRITKAVYDNMLDEARFASDGRNMWEGRTWTDMNNASIYRSDWSWRI